MADAATAIPRPAASTGWLWMVPPLSVISLLFFYPLA